jgi:hypothetical protein
LQLCNPDFVQVQATGIDGKEKGMVVRGVDAGKKPAYFILTEHSRKLLLPLGAQVIEGMPLTLQYIDEEEPNTAVTDTQGGTRPIGDILTVEEILLQFLLGNKVRGLVLKVSELAHRAGVCLLSALGKSVKLQGLH